MTDPTDRIKQLEEQLLRMVRPADFLTRKDTNHD